MVDVADEELHLPDPIPHWQESYYFNWANTDGSAYGLARVGFYEGGTKGDGLVLTIRDGVPEFLYGAIGADIDPPAHTSMRGGVEVGDLAFEMLEPLTRWRITLAGRDPIDLIWTAFMDAFDFASDGHFGDLAHHHFEHFGTVEGEMTLDGVRHEISGVGHRDKSWGPRDWSGASGWEWISAHFGTEIAFNVSIVTEGARPIRKGFVFRDGRTVGVTEATVDYEWADIEHVPAKAVIRLTDTDGERFELHATALGQAPLVKAELWLQETPCSFTMNHGGQTRNGMGVIEHTWHAGADEVIARLDQLAPIIALTQRASQATDPPTPSNPPAS